MAFSFQPPAPQGIEGAGDLHPDTVPDMVWISETDFNTNLPSHQNLQLARQNNAFSFEYEPDASSVISFPFSSFGDILVSQTPGTANLPQTNVSIN